MVSPTLAGQQVQGVADMCHLAQLFMWVVRLQIQVLLHSLGKGFVVAISETGGGESHYKAQVSFELLSLQMLWRRHGLPCLALH